MDRVNNQSTYQELKKLETDLVKAFKDFRKVYQQTINHQKSLTNQQIYDKIHDEYEEYHENLEIIKEKTIEVMNQLQKNHDQKQYHQTLNKIGISSKNARQTN